MTTVKTETNIKQIKLNKLSQEQYLAALNSGQIHDDEVYMTPDTSIEQFDHMPVASFEFQDKLVQFIGEEESGEETFVYGYFYECVALGTEPETYEWQQRNVQPASSLVWGNIEGNLSDQTDLQSALDKRIIKVDELPVATAELLGEILQYTGDDEVEYGLIHGYFYECILIEESGEEDVYAWKAIAVQPDAEPITEQQINALWSE